MARMVRLEWEIALMPKRAIHTLNWATYMARGERHCHRRHRPGRIITTSAGLRMDILINVPHFIDCMAALPQLAPADQDHLLSSSWSDHSHRVSAQKDRVPHFPGYWPTGTACDLQAQERTERESGIA